VKRRVLLLFTLLVFGAAAQGEPGRYGEVRFISSGLVSFTVTPEAYAAAVACPGCNYLYPDSGPNIVLLVEGRSATHPYTLEVFHSGWNPVNLNLEARYIVRDTGDSVRLTIPWMPVTEIPTQLFTQTQVVGVGDVRVTVEYRLRVTGNEAAGSFSAHVTHRIRQNNSLVTHDVRAVLPSLLTLRLVGGAAPGVHTVRFDYGSALQAYVQAVGSGTPLAVTTSDLQRVEISTNHPMGYTVMVTVSEVLGPPGGVSLRDRLLLTGAPAHGRRFSSDRPTNGFVTLITADQFGLLVDGGEAPGMHLLVVRYDAVSP